jgi:hypothetical protein
VSSVKPFATIGCLTPVAELDALSDLDESEPSYLTEVTAGPDFLDEAPQVPSNEVGGLDRAIFKNKLTPTLTDQQWTDNGTKSRYFRFMIRASFGEAK